MLMSAFVAALACAGAADVPASMPSPLVAAAARKEKPKTSDNNAHAPRDQELKEYLIEALPWNQRHVGPEVWAKFWPTLLLSAMLTWVGGQYWVPLLFYGDAPDHPARATARQLGLLGSAIACSPGALPCLWFIGCGWLVIIPVYGWAVMAVAAFVTFFLTVFTMIPTFLVSASLFPKAIALAYSDAYGLGGGAVKQEQPRKQTRESDD